MDLNNDNICRLHAEGKTDSQIAEALGTYRGLIRMRRERMGLPKNSKDKPPPKPLPVVVAEPEEPPTPPITAERRRQLLTRYDRIRLIDDIYKRVCAVGNVVS